MFIVIKAKRIAVALFQSSLTEGGHVCSFIFLYLTLSSAACFLNFDYAKFCTERLFQIAKFGCTSQATNL